MLFRRRHHIPGKPAAFKVHTRDHALEYKRVVYELKTHQIEIEMQNDELRRTEARLRETSKRYTDLYNFAPTGYLMLSPRGIIRDVNLKATSYLGVPRSSLIGIPLCDFITPASLPAFQDHLRQVLNATGSLICGIDMINSEGLVFEGELESQSWRDDKDEMPYIRSIFRDVSERNATERELKAARDKAEAANIAKSQFLANMSHEMRTPLGVILGFTDLLLNSSDADEDLPDGLKTIRRNGFHLLSLIDDLLDLAKIEAGEMQMELLEFPIRKEIEDLVVQFHHQAKAKNLELRFEALTPLPEFITTDPVRFRQIVLNIFGNALKFTSQGAITVELSMQETPTNHGPHSMLNIDITDSGCGISPEQMEMLFRPFTQADASTTRRFGGTGLGLSLARRLAEGLGGGVYLLQSEPNVGSTFRISVNPQIDPAPFRPKMRPREENNFEMRGHENRPM